MIDSAIRTNIGCDFKDILIPTLLCGRLEAFVYDLVDLINHAQFDVSLENVSCIEAIENAWNDFTFGAVLVTTNCESPRDLWSLYGVVLEDTLISDSIPSEMRAYCFLVFFYLFHAQRSHSYPLALSPKALKNLASLASNNELLLNLQLAVKSCIKGLLQSNSLVPHMSPPFCNSFLGKDGHPLTPNFAYRSNLKFPINISDPFKIPPPEGPNLERSLGEVATALERVDEIQNQYAAELEHFEYSQHDINYNEHDPGHRERQLSSLPSPPTYILRGQKVSLETAKQELLEMESKIIQAITEDKMSFLPSQKDANWMRKFGPVAAFDLSMSATSFSSTKQETQQPKKRRGRPPKYTIAKSSENQ